MKYSFFIWMAFISLLSISCNPDIQPKPKAFLKLSYPDKQYQKTQTNTPFEFEYAKTSILKTQSNHWFDINYPLLKANINATYHPVNNNIYDLIRDAEKLTFKHTVKADNIEVLPYENKTKRVYARLFQVYGDAASTVQFQITDSTKHFINGSLYFDARPNYDSILPAIDYLKKDIQHLIESIEWKE